MNIIEKINLNKFSYEEIRNKSDVCLLNDKEFHINVIIGFRGRSEFFIPLINSFKNAFSYYEKKFNDKTFCLTFVEHSEIRNQYKDKLENYVNYIWTPGNVSEQYSRSFAYNFGVKYSNKAKYYLLHDLDILVKENFFEEMFQNLGNSKCLQTYGGRRVLYLSQNLTPKIINKEIDFNLLNENSNDVSLPMFGGKPALGSKGGSILVENELYYKVGGFDPELFWGYGPEDQTFWDKISTLIGDISYADNPKIDMFHMWHLPTSSTNPLIYEMEDYMMQFKYMTKKNRIEFLELKKKLLKDE